MVLASRRVFQRSRSVHDVLGHAYHGLMSTFKLSVPLNLRVSVLRRHCSQMIWSVSGCFPRRGAFRSWVLLSHVHV